MTATLQDLNNVTQPVTLASRIHVEDITAQAHAAKPGNAAKSLLLAPFFAIGWVLGKGSRAVALASAYLGVAVRTGWRVAREEPLNQPRLEDVLEENRRLRAALERLDQSAAGFAVPPAGG